MADRPQCTVIVATRDRPAELARCLESLAQLTHPSHEIMVVDNSEGSAGARDIALAAGARYVVEPNVGLSVARNTGARHAHGKFVAFTDDDATVAGDWLTHLLRPMAAPAVVGTTGRVLLDLTPAGRAYSELGGEDQGNEPFTVNRATKHWFEIANFGGLGIGPSMAFRRSLFLAGFRFPEHLGRPWSLGGEEHYAFFRAIHDGGTIVYVPEAVVRHHCVKSFADVERRRRRILNESTAHMLMLLIEETGYRRQTLRYIVTGLRGRRREWRRSPAERPFATRAERIAAFGVGARLYLRNVVRVRRRARSSGH